VGSVESAKQAIDAGADGIIIQGREAGGHVIGQVCMLVNVLLYAYVFQYRSIKHRHNHGTDTIKV
ncbi:2-nitropropane dioxygenase-like protein, partial [Trifolium medium]|nr:2-nitropropane dioxygenase-like protein [Trifolium medium]